MKIKNVSQGNIELTDLRNPLAGGNRFVLPPNVEFEVFNEDAEKSQQLANHKAAGRITIVDTDEPFIDATLSNSDVTVSNGADLQLQIDAQQVIINDLLARVASLEGAS